MVSTKPLLASSLMPAFTTVRLTPMSSHSSLAGGSLSPGLSSPESILFSSSRTKLSRTVGAFILSKFIGVSLRDHFLIL